MSIFYLTRHCILEADNWFHTFRAEQEFCLKMYHTLSFSHRGLRYLDEVWDLLVLSVKTLGLLGSR